MCGCRVNEYIMWLINRDLFGHICFYIITSKWIHGCIYGVNFTSFSSKFLILLEHLHKVFWCMALMSKMSNHAAFVTWTGLILAFSTMTNSRMFIFFLAYDDGHVHNYVGVWKHLSYISVVYFWIMIHQ